MKSFDLILILASVLFTSLAQILLKAGMNAVGVLDFSKNFALSAGKILTNFYIYAGLFIFACSVSIWLVVLSRVPVSVAYPFVGLGCIFTMLFAYFFMGEPITGLKISGVLLISLGLFCITR